MTETAGGKEDVRVRVLLIEDEVLLAEQVADGLRDRGIAVDLAADGLDGLHKAGANRYDVVVLDRDLPLVHGDQVCTALAGDGSDARILMLTAAGEAADPGGGLDRESTPLDSSHP